MADAYTSAALPSGQSGTVVGANLVTQAYDRLVEFQLRATPQFRAIADKKVADQTHPGSSVLFQIYSDLADESLATATLTETVDPDAVAVPATTTLAVTLAEYGRTVITTRKLDLFSLADVEPAVANIVAFNMAATLDNGVAAVLDGGSNFIRESAGSLSTSAAKTTITATDTLKGRDIRHAITKMRAANVVPRRGNFYVSYLHPEVSHDLRTETGNNIWRTPHEYQALDNLYAGEIGAWEGCIFVETPRMTNSQSGSGTGGTQTRVYNSYVLGAQALAEAVAEEPHMTMGNVVDKFNRFRPVGWYGVLGWARYRSDALWRIETASSVRPNA
jgi:N4-gp56 family major capsid protein